MVACRWRSGTIGSRVRQNHLPVRLEPVIPPIKILGTGRVDDQDSAFPKTVQLPAGDLLCAFNVGGGPLVEGPTQRARSTDLGRTWHIEGTILPADTDPPAGNTLKLSLSPDGTTIYAYGSFHLYGKTVGQGLGRVVLCTSTDQGRTWSQPVKLPMPRCDLGTPDGVLAADTCRLLAPAITRRSPQMLGEQALIGVSDDGGRTWPRVDAVFEDPARRYGYFEMKLARLGPKRLMAVCWCTTMGQMVDQPNRFRISSDNGETWGPIGSTGIMGQTMTPVHLGGDRLLLLYNRRRSERPGVVMALVDCGAEPWVIHHEALMYDARALADRPASQDVKGFAFGFPTAIRLHDDTFLATHWSREQGRFGVRWTRLRVQWPQGAPTQ